MTDLLIRDAAEILTCAPGAPDLIGRLPGGSVAISDGLIEAVGEVGSRHARRVLDATGRVVLPGFVDCHTHVVFGGSRVEEYAARVAGREPPAGAPVGIAGTVRETRRLGTDALVSQAIPRLGEMLAHGTTTAESKTGYGLSLEAELSLLEANRRLAGSTPMEIVSTLLAAHALPDDMPRDAYVDLIVDRIIPRVGAEGLAQFCDAYCDEGYFTLAETRRVLAAGRAHGLTPKLHLDAYSATGAAAVAADLGAASVDHLNFTSAAEARTLAAAGVVAVAMPCLDLAVAHPRPVDVRGLARAGTTIALATDICPACHVASMQLVIQLACRLYGMSVAEAIRAATLHSAMALRRERTVGSLEPGKQADVLILGVARHEELAYRLGSNLVERVIKRGQVVVER
jgi:imidazolonepropionase